MTSQSDAWPTAQTILVILAHPDDPEFFCGATLARWVRSGHQIHYLLLTGGDKGGRTDIPPDELRSIRHDEQQRAAAVIGIRSVNFMDLEDGMLLPNLELRRKIVHEIRFFKPDILVTCDPTLLYTSFGRLNHPDHRAAGQVVLDAVFPASGNGHFYSDMLATEGLSPHTPHEIWIALPVQPTTVFDVTDLWPVKLKALKEHRSQIGDPVVFEQRMRSRHSENSTDDVPRFEEKFRVIKLV